MSIVTMFTASWCAVMIFMFVSFVIISILRTCDGVPRAVLARCTTLVVVAMIPAVLQRSVTGVSPFKGGPI